MKTVFSPEDLVRLDAAKTPEILHWAWEHFGPRAAIGTSFQGAGLVMMHLAKKAGLRFPIFTLDTGLLFPETYELKTQIERFLDVSIESLVPDLTVEQQAEAMGPELWKREPDQCCTLRKVIPLQARLASLDCWITGLRREQAETRSETKVVEVYEFEPGREIFKLNPMAAWSRQQVWDYIKQHQIPYNPLQDRGYKSIGCMPCTRPVGEADGERAGRWTGFSKTECGIHTFMVRKK